MRRRTLMSSYHHDAINVTPLIDVVMCLIVFFLLVGKLVEDRAAHVALPETQQGDSAKAKAPLVIDIVRAPGSGSEWLHGEALVYVTGKPVANLEEFQTIVTSHVKAAPETSLEIRADRALRYGVVEPVLRACTEAGAMDVRLATERRS
jgi:biopolymer transport protein ExbD